MSVGSMPCLVRVCDLWPFDLEVGPSSGQREDARKLNGIRAQLRQIFGDAKTLISNAAERAVRMGLNLPGPLRLGSRASSSDGVGDSRALSVRRALFHRNR